MGFKYELKTPATAGEKTITCIEFPEVITTGHMMATDGYLQGSIAADHALVAALTGESETIIKKISIKDFAVIRVELKKIWMQYFGVDTEKKPQAENPPPNQNLDK